MKYVLEILFLCILICLSDVEQSSDTRPYHVKKAIISSVITTIEQTS